MERQTHCWLPLGVLLLVSLPAEAQKTRKAKPLSPTGLCALPNYATNEIQLFWSDTHNESGYEIFRITIPGPLVKIGDSPANCAKYVDTTATTTDEYFYRVRAVNSVGRSPFSESVRQNLKTLWPVPASHEVLHNWNETIGTAAVDETMTATGFHAGVDIQRSGANNDVVAVRGGQVKHVVPGPNGLVVVGSVTSSGLEYYQANHIKKPVVTVNQCVHAGQKLAQIDTEYFVDFVDHIHYVITNTAFVPLPRHPLDVFTSPADRDPKGKIPELFDHAGTDTGLFFFEDEGAVRYPVDLFPAMAGDLDIIVEVRDEMGTSPDQVPTVLGYWIEHQISPACPTSPMAHDVKSAAEPYLLFSWASAYFGDAGTPMRSAFELSQEIADYGQDHGCSITERGMKYPWPNYKNFIVTNTKGIDGSPANVDKNQYWNTNAVDDTAPETSAHANYAGMLDTTDPREARFPDGDYLVHILSGDLTSPSVEPLCFFSVLPCPIRLENFCPIVCEAFPEPGIEVPATTILFAQSVVFSEAMDESVSPASILSIDNGATIMAPSWSAGKTINFAIFSLVPGQSYTIAIDGMLAKDKPGFPKGGRMLDGNEDGVCGDDYTWQFSVALP